MLTTIRHSFNRSLTDQQFQIVVTVMGHLFFWAYLLWCILYFKERLFACDAASYTFNLVNNEAVFYKHNRHVAYLTQYPAVLAMKWDASLQTVLKIYSGMFGLWFYIIFLLIRYVLKNYQAVLLLLFSLCLTMRYKHYAGHTEITFAMAVGGLLFAWMTTRKEQLQWYRPWMHWVGLVFICGWLYTIHPIIVIPLSVWFAADILQHHRWKDWQNWLSIIIVWAVFALKFFEVSQDPYESGKVNSLSTSMDVFINYQDYPIIYEIIQDYFIGEYYLVFPLFVASLVWLCFRKKILLALFLLASFTALLALNIVVHSYLGGKVLIMVDGYMGMLGMVFGIAYLYAFTEQIKKVWVQLLFASIIIFSVHQIEVKHLFFKRRLQAHNKTFALNEPHRKLHIGLKDFNWQKMWYPYQVPLESLMLTSLEGKEYSKTTQVNPDWWPDQDVINSTNFLDANKGVRRLNPRYFSLPEEGYFITDKVGWKK